MDFAEVETQIVGLLASSRMTDYQKAALLQSLATMYAFRAVGGYGSTSIGPSENFVLTSAEKPIE